MVHNTFQMRLALDKCRVEVDTRPNFPQGYKLFHAQLSWERNFNCSKQLKYQQMKKFFNVLSLSDVFIMLINVKMPTIVGILSFKSRINFVLNSWKKFFNLKAWPCWMLLIYYAPVMGFVLLFT